MSLPTISLAEFNRLASGSYNAGQVDFKTNSAGEFTGELVKINNHVIFKSKNNVHLTGERVVAIKEAFLDALQKARVDEKALKEIRAELGMTGELDANSDANKTLLDKRYTPLSRDQIRKMLDKYANQGRGGEGGEGVATEREVQKGERTRHMSESKQKDRNDVNSAVGGTVTAGRDNTILHTIKLMTGAALDEINETRMNEITGTNAVNERGESKTILTNSFATLYGQMLKMLNSNESDEFKLLGQDAKLIKDNGKLSVLLGKGVTQTKLNLDKSVDDIICRMIGQAVGSRPLLGNKILKEMLETTYARDMDEILVAGDRSSLSRQFAAIIVMKASEVELEKLEAKGERKAEDESVRFDDIVEGNYNTECLVDVALRAIDHGEEVATKAALDEFYGHIRQFNSTLSEDMKGMLRNVLDMPISKPGDDVMMEVSIVKNPDKILEKMDAGGAQPGIEVKPADVADVKNFVADMVYSDDMLFMELSEDVNAGAKMREALSVPGRANALAEIIKNPDVLNCAVAPTIADVVKGGMQKFIEVLDASFKKANGGECLADAAKKENFAARLAEFMAESAKISDNELAKLPMIMQSMAIKGCEKLQTFINEVFNIDTTAQNAAGGLTTDPYKGKSASQIKSELDAKSLDEIRSDASQADTSTPGQIGLFKQVMSEYFTGMGRSDKKTIFAAALKYADTFDFRGLDGKDREAAVTKATSKFVGAVLKGTSPLMQKMMQGMPKSIMGKFSEALDDMKSKLAPIPRKIVQAHLLKMIEDNNKAQKNDFRKIQGIEIKKSLGAASVGEAFLCTIKYTEKRLGTNPDDPWGPEILRDFEMEADVVIKIMRPDAEERVKREAEVFTAAAKKIGEGMSATWQGQLKQYMTEFDFTNEAKNVKEGEEIYEVAENGASPYKAIAPSVSSMRLTDIIKTTKNAMVCDLVQGETVDRIVSNTHKEIGEAFGKIFETDPETGKLKKVEGADGKKKPVMRSDAKFKDVATAKTNALRMYNDLVKMQKDLMQAGKVWFSEALLASGKFHGDAHAGNLMYCSPASQDVSKITFIDFGNLYQLKTDAPLLDAAGNPVIDKKTGQPQTINERVELLRLILGATLRNEGFVLQSVERLLSPAGKAALAANRAKAEAAIKAINDKGNFSFHACYRLEAIISELQKLGLELPPQINCFIQSMTRMQNMLAETNALLADIKMGIDAMKDFQIPEGTEVDESDILGKCLLEMNTAKGKEMVQDVDSNGEPKFQLDKNGNPTNVPLYEKKYIVDMRTMGSEDHGVVAFEDDTGFRESLMERFRKAEDKEALVRKIWNDLAAYDSTKRTTCDNRIENSLALLANRNMDLENVLKTIVSGYALELSEVLKNTSLRESEYQTAEKNGTASFAQVIMTVVFSGGDAVQDMFDKNFSGVDKISLGLSAKAISKEIGGSTWEFTQTTMNRLVKGAHVLGENDAKNTNVDNIEFDTSKLDLNI